MNVSRNQGTSDADPGKKMPSTGSNQRGPIGITPQTPQDDEVINQRIKEGTPPKSSERGLTGELDAASDSIAEHCATDDGNDQAVGGEKTDDAPKSKYSDTEGESTQTVGSSKNSPPNERTRRLSSSLENMDLERTLGSLDAAEPHTPPAKRQRLQTSPTKEPSPSPATRKKLSLMIESAAEAMTPEFWNDGASVSKDNVPAKSYDVANDESVGGSSPIGRSDSAVEDSSTAGYERQLSAEERRSIASAEEIMMVAVMAADVLDEDEVATPTEIGDKSQLGTSKAKSEQSKDTKDDHGLDFDKMSTMQSTDNDQSDVKSDISSASSLVESYPEDEESKPFPPAPPSTPATAKDMYQPLPYQPESAAGSLEYTVELKGNESSSSWHQQPTPLATPRGPPLMPEDAYGDDVETPRPATMSYSAATAETPRGDISGEVTERRQGQGYKKSQVKIARKSDFDLWDVGDRYELKRILGRGSYGEVAQAVDKHAVAWQERAMSQAQQSQPNPAFQNRNSTYVAVKKISKAFDQEVDAVRLFREIHILRRLRGHECIIQLVDVVQPRSSDLNLFNDLYLVFEYVDTDLYKLIMSPQYLTTEHIQTFLYQMLVGLKYIHSSSG